MARRLLLVSLALLAATVFAYAPVLRNGFVDYDDQAYVVRVPEVAAGLTPRSVAWAFTSTQGANWLPLTRLSWIVDAELFGLDAPGFHATSLALHALNALLLLLALARLTGALWPSAFVAAVFALHPLHVESVAWVAARKDLVSGLFFMLALLAHERRARDDRPVLWTGVLAAVLALGLMAKPVLVTLPFVLLLLDLWPLRRWRPGALWSEAWPLLREKGLLFALVLLSCVLTIQLQEHAMASGSGFPIVARLVNALLALFDYVSRALWPVDLAVLYPLPRSVGMNRVALLFLGFGLAGVLAWRALPSRPWYFVGGAWFLGMLVPVLGFVQVGVQASADRYTYLPLIGLSIAFAWGARDALALLPVAPRRAAVSATALAAILLCVAMAGATRQQVRVWRDSRTLFEHTLAVTQDNAWGHYYMGLILETRGEVGAALAQYQHAVALSPEEPLLRSALDRASAYGRRR